MVKDYTPPQPKLLAPFCVKIDHIPGLKDENGQKINKNEKSLNELPSNLWGFIWFFTRQYKGLFFISLFLFSLAQICQVSIPLFLKEIIELIAADDSSTYLDNQTSFFWLSVGLITIGYGGYHVFWSIADYISACLYLCNFREMIRNQLFYYASYHDISFFQNDFSGRIADKIQTAGFTIDLIIDDILYVAAGSIISLIFIVFIFFDLHILFLSILLIWLAVSIIIGGFLIAKCQKKASIFADAQSRYAGILVDVISNMPLVKLNAGRQISRQTLNQYGQISADRTHDFYFTWVILRAFLGIMAIILAGTFITLCYQGYRDQWLTIGDITLVLSILPLLLQYVWTLTTNMARISENLGTVQDIISTIIRPQRPWDENQDDRHKITSQNASIALKNIHFDYNKDRSESLKAIDNISCEIQNGEKIGLIGRSGAGKSTLVHLLLRFYDVTSGEISIAGQDINDYNLDNLRRQIAIVSQDSSLFHRSIAENIAYGCPNASQDDIIAAAKRAHAHEFIQGLEDKDGNKAYDSLVGERGVKLSGGQRQRIAIARAILKDAPILILDEATSALDSESEKLIQDSLQELMKGKTVIAIAHRLSTIAHLDRLIVMDKGQIIEDGTHEDLLKNKDGLYAKLWTMQSGGFLGE